MKNFYGPFYEGKDNVWHWRKECPDFPIHVNPKMMVSSNFPSQITMCNKCTILDKEDSDSKRMTMTGN